MKTLLTAACLGAVVLALAVMPAMSQPTYNFVADLSGGIELEDEGEAVVTRQITGSGIPEIASINLTFSISDGFNGDLYMALRYHLDPAPGPADAFAVLLNRVGKTDGNPAGYAHPGFFNVTLSNDASNDIHTYGDVQDPGAGNPLFEGVWLPDARNEDPDDVTDQTPRSAGHDFSVFHGLSADGYWTLYMADMSAGGGTTMLDAWSMTIVGVPEPSPAHLALAAGVFLVGFSCWRRRRRAATI